MNKILKKVTAVALAAMTFASAFSFTANAAVIGNDDTTTEKDLSRYGEYISNDELGEIYSYGGYISKDEYLNDLKKSRDGSVSAGIHPTFSYATDTGGNVIKVQTSMAGQHKGSSAVIIKINGSRAYCIEPGEPLNVSSSLTQNNAMGKWLSLSYNQRTAINAALCFGMEGNYSAIKGNSTIKEDQCYLATQVIIWEIVKGQRNATAPYALKSGSSGYINVYCANGANPNIKTAYNRITSAMSKYWTIPSFAKRSANSAPTYTLKATYNEATNKWTYGSLTLTDNNKVLSSFKSLAGTYNVGNATVKATISGNTLKLTCSNGKATNAESKTVTVTADKTGIPTTNNGKLLAYSSPSVQDCVTGGDIDPPNAAFKVKVDIDKTGRITRDGRILKSCWTEEEANDPDVDNGEGSLSTPENLDGWYFYVKVPSEFKEYYGVDHIVLSTDETGYTEYLSDYIKKNLDKSITHGVPNGYYDIWELGKLKDGASGKDYVNDYYFPEGWSQEYDGVYGSEYPAGTLRLATDGSGENINQLDIVGYVNNVFKFPVSLKKVNEDGSSTKGYYFTLTNNDTKKEYTLRTDNDGYLLCNPDTDGINTTYDGHNCIQLPDGNYTLHELGKKVGSGYEIPDRFVVPADIDFEVSADALKTAQENGLKTITVTMQNNCQGYVRVHKTDASNNNALSGAVFGVFSDANCQNLLFELDKTDADGYATSEEPLSCNETFYVKEITAPDGYIASDKIYEVNIKPANTTTIYYDIEAKNTPTKVEFVKTDEDGNLIAGVKLQVLDSSKKVIEEWTTDGKSNHQIAGKLVVGQTYYLHEVSAPNNYQLASDKKFTVSDTAEVQTITMVNREKTGSVTLNKKNANGQILNGSQWKLYYSDGTQVNLVQTGLGSYTISSTNRADVLETNTSGKLSVTDLPLGDYYFTEHKAPNGYVQLKDKIEFTISAESETTLNVVLDVKNNPTKVEFVKTDEDGNLIAGVKLQVLDSSKKVIEEWTTDGKSNHQIAGKLIVGQTYTLHEVSAPNEYTLAIDKTFTVKDTTEVQTVTMVNKKKTGNVTLYKQDGDGNALKGSEWKLYNADGTLVNLVQNGAGSYVVNTTNKAEILSTDNDGVLRVYNLPLGDYYFVENKSPNGTFTYGDKIEFTISAESDKTLNPELTVQNNKIILQNTGASGNSPLYFAGLTTLLMSISVIVLYFRKKKYVANK